MIFKQGDNPFNFLITYNQPDNGQNQQIIKQKLLVPFEYIQREVAILVNIFNMHLIRLFVFSFNSPTHTSRGMLNVLIARDAARFVIMMHFVMRG